MREANKSQKSPQWFKSRPRWLSWWSGGCRSDPCWIRQHSFMEIDHEIGSTAILSFLLIQEGQFPVSGERMHTVTGYQLLILILILKWSLIFLRKERLDISGYCHCLTEINATFFIYICVWKPGNIFVNICVYYTIQGKGWSLNKILMNQERIAA